MKLSFLAAIAIGIATVVAVILLWNLVEAIGLWSQIDQLGRDLNGGEPLPFMEFFTFSKMTSYGTIVAVVNVVIITALGTLMAFLYNLVAALLGCGWALARVASAGLPPLAYAVVPAMGALNLAVPGVGGITFVTGSLTRFAEALMAGPTAEDDA